jgi:DNA polymerase-3 subunit epsilon
LDGFTEIHGLTHLDVLDAPQFLEIAPEFLARLNRSKLVIAHNAEFDMRKLRGTLAHFGIPCLEFDYLCTCQLARRVWPDLPNHKLGTLTMHIGHEFNYHHAQSDAEAAGRVLLAMMQQVSATKPHELLQKFGLVPKQLRD